MMRASRAAQRVSNSEKEFLRPFSPACTQLRTLSVVFSAINAKSFVSCCAHTGLHPVDEKVVKLRSKRHCNQRFCAFGLRMSYLRYTLPAWWSDLIETGTGAMSGDKSCSLIKSLSRYASS